jgi:Spirocyclase AveC-like
VAVIERPSGVSLRPGLEQAGAQPKNRTVVAWAVLGTACMCLMIYVFAAWIASPYFHHEQPGVTPIPTLVQIGADVQQISGVVLTLVIGAMVVWRPYRRDQRLSLDALFILGMIWVWWQDPLYSYFKSGFSYSTVTFNMGSWACKIPGWQSPNGCRLAQPLPWDFTFYVIGMAGGVIFAAWLLRRWRARNPQMSSVTLMLGTFAFFYLADLICEGTWVRLGLYHYGSGIPGIELFSGKWYQFPLFEPLAVSLMLSAMTAVRFFVNDRGETIVERGAADLPIGARGRTFVRFLAIVGMLNVCMLVLWAGTTNFFVAHGQAWPKSIQERSWLNPGICGPGTSYACAGTNSVATPLSGKSAHISTSGKVVISPGTDTSQFQPIRYLTK